MSLMRKTGNEAGDLPTPGEDEYLLSVEGEVGLARLVFLVMNSEYSMLPFSRIPRKRKTYFPHLPSY